MEISKRKDVICFNITKSHKEKLKELAQKEKRSTSQFLQIIIEDYLKKAV